MISDQGGDEGRLSTYHLNRFGAEGGEVLPQPPPLGAAAFALTKLRGEREKETSTAETVSGAFLQRGGEFFRARIRKPC